MINLAEAHPEQVRRLEAELRRHSGQNHRRPQEIDQEQVERLRSLGYSR